MAFNIQLTGMVLSAIPVRDYDKRLVILTRERGKITAFAKGARRSGNQLMAAANPFVFGEFEVYQGKSSYTLVRASINNYFRELAMDYDLVCYASYFTEMAEYYAQENLAETTRLQLLYQSLRALESGKYERHLVKAIYELKTLAIAGEYPNVFACVHCGKKDQLVNFSMRHGGCICPSCLKEAGGNPLHPSTLYAMQFVISQPVEKLFTFKLSPEVLTEMADLINAYRKHYEGHTYRSEGFLPKE